MSQKSDHKMALVVEGGGMRGVFSAGVLNAFGASGFDPFDLYLGVSAGACNLASHIAGQNDRNFYIYKHWSSTPRFISMGRFLRGGHLMDLDWLWDVTIGEYRLNLDTIFGKKDKTFVIVATSMTTGKPLYLEPTRDNLEHTLKVSSALPVVYREKLTIHGELATDGGIADSIPVREAFKRGAKTIMVLRSRPVDYVKQNTMSTKLLARLLKPYPNLTSAIRNRAANYMASVDFIRTPPPGIKILEISPPETVTVRRLTRNVNALESDYQLGIQEGLKAMGAFQKLVS